MTEKEPLRWRCMVFTAPPYYSLVNRKIHRNAAGSMPTAEALPCLTNEVTVRTSPQTSFSSTPPLQSKEISPWTT